MSGARRRSDHSFGRTNHHLAHSEVGRKVRLCPSVATRRSIRYGFERTKRFEHPRSGVRRCGRRSAGRDSLRLGKETGETRRFDLLQATLLVGIDGRGAGQDETGGDSHAAVLRRDGGATEVAGERRAETGNVGVGIRESGQPLGLGDAVGGGEFGVGGSRAAGPSRRAVGGNVMRLAGAQDRQEDGAQTPVDSRGEQHLGPVWTAQDLPAKRQGPAVQGHLRGATATVTRREQFLAELGAVVPSFWTDRLTRSKGQPCGRTVCGAAGEYPASVLFADAWIRLRLVAGVTW